MRNLRKKEHGVMMILTLMLLAILWFAVLSFSAGSLNSLHASAAYLASERAITAAESGLTYTVRSLRENPEYRPGKAGIPVGEGGEKFLVRLFSPREAPLDIPEDCLYLESTGFARTGLVRKAVAVVRVGGGSVGFFDYGIFSSSLDVKGGSRVAVFDSTGKTQNLDGLPLVGTNSTKKGEVRLHSGAIVDGAVYVGPGGETKDEPKNPWMPTWGTENVVWKNWSATTQGEKVLDSEVEYPEVEAPDSGDEKVKVDWKGADLEPGAYRELQAGGGGEVRLRPGTYVFDMIKLQGGSSLKVEGNDPVIIYIKKNLDITNGSFFNSERKARNLIFLVEGESHVDIRGGSNAYLSIYGPKAKVKIKGGNNVSGAIVADNVQLESGSVFTYDVALKNDPPGLPGLKMGGSGSGGGGVSVLGWYRF